MKKTIYGLRSENGKCKKSIFQNLFFSNLQIAEIDISWLETGNWLRQNLNSWTVASDVQFLKVIIARPDHQLKKLTKIWWQLIGHPSTPDFSGELDLNFALGLVTSCCSCQTACWRPACCWVGWGSMSIGDPSKSQLGGIGVYKKVSAIWSIFNVSKKSSDQDSTAALPTIVFRRLAVQWSFPNYECSLDGSSQMRKLIWQEIGS